MPDKRLFDILLNDGNVRDFWASSWADDDTILDYCNNNYSFYGEEIEEAIQMVLQELDSQMKFHFLKEVNKDG